MSVLKALGTCGCGMSWQPPKQLVPLLLPSSGTVSPRDPVMPGAHMSLHTKGAPSNTDAAAQAFIAVLSSPSTSLQQEWSAAFLLDLF